MTEELKPCPFCASGEILRANAMFGWVCLCRSCSARGPSPNNATDVEAAAAWNARAESAEVERLRARVAELEAAQAWRPIEGAPKDGRSVVLADGIYNCTAHWLEQEGDWSHWPAVWLKPTHYLPLPPMPEGS